MLALLLAIAQSPTVKLSLGLTISKSVRVAPEKYAILPPEEARCEIPGKGVILVRGNNIMVDFQGATLQGSPTITEPNDRAGTGLDISGKNITILHAVICGYKVGLIARHAPGLKLIGCDFSYNWKQHLRSTLEKEDESDWQSYHQNEHEEWLRYGAGAYLQDCKDFEVRGCRGTGGQCGLMLCRCDGGKVWNNDFSFMSGLGLGMYRSSDNVVMHNKFDWCVRGFSYGVYNRGQDSAGILVYEQSSRNMFAYNSATHGGDGFFLWAGQQTMDTGEGGCNDNLLYGNDFSHAPANGIEATFSRNKFVNNLMVECDYGIWGGYSYDTISDANLVAASRIGMAFEHSQRCEFNDNQFFDDKTGIQLWGAGTPDPNWGYGKHHEVRSLDNAIRDNSFGNVSGPCVSLRDCGGTLLASNSADTDGDKVRLDAKNAPVTELGRWWTLVSDHLPTYKPIRWKDEREYPGKLSGFIDSWNPFKPDSPKLLESKPLAGGMNPFLPRGTLRGRKYMLVDEWGPYDFRYPRLWPRGEDAKGNKLFEVLGPKGEWQVMHMAGAKIVGPSSGTTPAFLKLALPGGAERDVSAPLRSAQHDKSSRGQTSNDLSRAGNIKLTLEYIGKKATDYRGIITPAGQPVTFSYTQFFAPINWNIEFFKWDDETDPRTHDDAFRQLLAGNPIATAHSTKLDYSGYGAWAPGVPGDKFAISATGDFTVDAGKYTLDLTTDDGARIFLDRRPLQLYDEAGKPASAFHYQGPTTYTASLDLSRGKHRFYVEYFQIDGYKTLQLRLKPRRRP